jgi:hypothetical protein
MTFSKLLRPIIIVLLSISAISIIVKLIYTKYYNKSQDNERETFVQNTQTVPSAPPTRPIEPVVSAAAPAVASTSSYSVSSGPYIQNTNPSDNKFPTLNADQQKCIGKFTADCLKTLSATQGALYNSLVSAPSDGDSSMRTQIAYNTAVISPQ